MIYLQLFLEFFKIGLFSVGGGYATMPFLHHIVTDYGWYTSSQLSNMIAISMLTPGPVGVNMATFAGFQTKGIFGGIFATLALVLPSYLLVLLVAKMLKTFRDNIFVKSILTTLKPAGCGLLLAVGCKFFIENVNSIWALILFALLFAVSFKFKKNPLYYFVFAAVYAIGLQLLNIAFL